MTPTACRVCRQLLNRYTDLHTGTHQWRHPASAGRPDHDPQPVPAHTVAAEHRCDFCSDPRVVYAYRTGNIDAHFVTDQQQQIHRYGTDWAACIDCARLLDAHNAHGLATRCLTALPTPLTGNARHALHRLHATIVDNLQPGRTVTSIGRWQPTALPAPIMPKVRDRLTALLRSDDSIATLTSPALRRTLAEGMETARLYWIDPDFTDLTRHATNALPDTPLHTDLPAPHGLLAWATPLHTLVATSWTSTPGGLLTAGYRSIGDSLGGPSLQRLREHVGWLIPTWSALIPDGAPVTGADPAGPLAATLLLIAQQLATTTDAPANDRIRRDHRRRGQDAPTVRLVSLRGITAATRRGGATASSEAADREFRWWVRGHWRQQPYGPGRVQRRLIYINPQLRGPHDKPIKPTTTVRVLGRH